MTIATMRLVSLGVLWALNTVNIITLVTLLSRYREAGELIEGMRKCMREQMEVEEHD